MPKKILYFVIFIFLIKCLLASFIPIVADESYYYIWSAFPKLSYFDHPGMVSWLIYLGTHLLPIHNPIGIRLFFIILSTATVFIWLTLLRKKNATLNQQLLFLALFVLNPLLGIGSIMATPDVPLVFFWSLAYYCFVRLFETLKIRWYVFLGVSLGLGFCSKYHIVLFVLAGAVTLLVNKKWRLLQPIGIFATLASGFVFSLPVLIWNYQNEWISFLFQINHGFGRSNYNFEWTYSYLMGQVLIMSPFVALNLFRKRKASDNQIFSVSQIIFFLTSTFKSVVEANWPIVAQPHALEDYILIEKTKRIRWTFYYWFFIYVSIAGILFSPAGSKILKNQLITNDVRPLVEAARTYRPLYGPTYQISSLLSWESKVMVPKLRGFSRKDFYDSLEISVPAAKKFFVLKDVGSDWPDYLSSAKFLKLDSFDNLALELYQVTYD